MAHDTIEVDVMLRAAGSRAGSFESPRLRCRCAERAAVASKSFAGREGVIFGRALEDTLEFEAS